MPLFLSDPLMYTIKPTKTYRSSLKKLVRSGRFDISTLEYLINLLAAGIPLDAQYKNHPLLGEYAGCFECHLKGDLLLIYRIDRKEKLLTIVDIGSHGELFG